MNKKSLLSIILALILCFTTVVPAAAAPVFAADDTAVIEETQTQEVAPAEQDEDTVSPQEVTDDLVPSEKLTEKSDTDYPVLSEFDGADTDKPLPSLAVGDGVVVGDGEFVFERDENLYANNSWTYNLETPRSCMVYFYVESDEGSYTEALFSITVTNNDTGAVVYSDDDWVNEEYYWEDSIGLDPGSYTVSFTNEDYVYNHYYFDIYYSPLHTVDDPYFSIDPFYADMYTGQTKQLTALAQPEPATYESVTWSSENPAVATVDANGLVTATGAGETVIHALIDGYDTKCYIFVVNPTFKLSASKATLYVKDTKTLKLTVDPSDYDLSGLKWTSSNTKVATVNAKGVVTAKAKGTATISATVNGKTFNCAVTVKPMSISKSKATIYVKKTQQLKVNGGSGTATWKSSNKKVATVTSKGVVKGIKPGTATITAKKNGKTFKCKVTVKWEPETGKVTTKTYNVSYSESADINMQGPGKISLTITNTDSGDYADNLDVTVYNPSWNTIIDVSVAPGKTKTVTANTTAKGDFYLSCYGYGKVVLKKTTKPAITKSTLKVGKGYTGTLKVVGVKNGGKWSSSNKKIATVTSKGVVKGKKKGTCYIKYTLKTGKVLKCKVTVVNPVTCKVTNVYDTSVYNECDVKFTNYTNKKITYIKFKIKQYDNKGSRLYDSPYSWYYVNDDLKANSSATWYEFWISDDAKKCTAYITKVYFSDGTTWTP